MKLKTGYSDLTPSEAVKLGDSVGENMTGKAVWAAFVALLTQLPLDVQAVRDAMKATGPGASTQLRLAEDKLANQLGDIAQAANDTTAATEADLAGTGLPIVKQRVSLTEPPPAPTNLRLRHGQMPGDVDGTVDPIPGGNIRGYEGQWTLDPDNGPWSEIYTFPNSRSIRFTKLGRGKDTWFRLRARNTVGAGPWCDPATLMVT
jgi:hypothetical protein